MPSPAVPLGVLIARGILQLFLAVTPLELPRIDQVGVDASVVAFACVITILTGLVFGALPAWRLTRDDPQEALRTGSHTVTEGRRTLRLREGLIGLEVAVSTGLLIIAALLGSSLIRLLQVDKGFDYDRVLTVDVSLARQQLRKESSAASSFLIGFWRMPARSPASRPRRLSRICRPAAKPGTIRFTSKARRAPTSTRSTIATRALATFA